MFGFLDDLFFPKRCINCGKFGEFICSKCRTKISYVEYQICPKCKKNTIDGKTHKLCKRKTSLDGLVSVLNYRHEINKKLIELIKYKFIYGLSKMAMELAFSFFIDKHFLAFEQFLRQQPMVVPVPLQIKRLKWRGFNQSAVLATEFAQRTKLNLCQDLLIRTRETKPQVELKGIDRHKNIKSAFVINQEKLSVVSCKPSAVLLLDDVWTTGATMRECGLVLKKGGIAQVWGLTLAR